MIVTKEDIKHLRWIHDRMHFVHGESTLIDYMSKFKKIVDNMDNPNVILRQLVNYEIISSWWASWISNEWLQDKVAAYYVKKVKRNLKRIEQHEQYKAELVRKLTSPTPHSL